MTRTGHEAALPTPWYRHFWPWFIVVLMGISVTAALYTVWIAVVNRDSLVSDDWYEVGTAINRRFERDEVARRLEVAAELEVDAASRTVAVALSGRDLDDLESLVLSLSHPTMSARDHRVRLLRGPDGRWSGISAAPLSGRWYVTLGPDPALIEAGAPDWQLSDQLTLAPGGTRRLGASR